MGNGEWGMGNRVAVKGEQPVEAGGPGPVQRDQARAADGAPYGAPGGVR